MYSLVTFTHVSLNTFAYIRTHAWTFSALDCLKQTESILSKKCTKSWFHEPAGDSVAKPSDDPTDSHYISWIKQQK